MGREKELYFIWCKEERRSYEEKRGREKLGEWSLIKENGKGDFIKEKVISSVKYGGSWG